RISIIEPSECGRADGQILIDNLIPNQDYTISFEDQNDSFSFTETADSNGEIVVRDLYANLYRNLIVSSDQSGCQSFFGNVTLENPDFQLQLVVAPPSSCNIPEGSLQITGLTPGTDYEISYIYNGIRKEDVLTSNASGEIVVTSLNAGDYENVAISSVIGNCTYFEPHLALFCEEDSELCFTVKKFFTPNGDGVDDHWFLEPDGTCEITTQIYDRYGRLIVTLTPDKPHWDGRYHGKPMPSSDYWCSVRYTNGTISNVYRFNFALKR
ncbi:MAG: T9SS type B sorting domain-containing protein, partial [Allomuricauda sp.]